MCDSSLPIRKYHKKKKQVLKLESINLILHDRTEYSTNRNRIRHQIEWIIERKFLWYFFRISTSIVHKPSDCHQSLLNSADMREERKEEKSLVCLAKVGPAFSKRILCFCGSGTVNTGTG
jgi:hypothetical protein